MRSDPSQRGDHVRTYCKGGSREFGAVQERERVAYYVRMSDRAVRATRTRTRGRSFYSAP